MPSCGLPYNNSNSAMSAIIKLFENIPFLPDLTSVESNDTLLNITLSNVPCIVQRENRLFLEENSEYKKYLRSLELTYNNLNEENIEHFRSDSVFMERYYKSIERIKPKETVIRLYGPFSLFLSLSNVDCGQALMDQTLRKFVVHLYTLKATWFITNIYTLSPDTTPIFILEEPLLNKFSSVKRKNENVDSRLLIDLYSKIFNRLHKFGALCGIQCFEKCDWKIAIDSNVDIISFDAFHNPNNLGIISAKVNEFLSKGGIINWGIVPMESADVLMKMNAETLYDRLEKTIDEVSRTGISYDLLKSRALVSVVGDIYGIPLIFSEKALLLANKIASRLDKDNFTPPEQH